MGARDEDGVALEKVTALFKTEKEKEKEKGWDEWEVLEMDVQEEIGQPTYGQLVIAATRQNFDFSPMLGKSCVLILSRGYYRRRYFKGLVFRIEHQGEYPFGSVAKIDFATAVRAMQHGQDSRVFENQTVPQILDEVFKEALEPFCREVRVNLSRTYPVREYCTQYKESDWNFVQRLMADEGITFYLDEGGKEADRETVVLVDSNDSFPEIETMEEPQPAGHASGPLGLLAEMVEAAVPEVHPVLEPAKLVLVVRKEAKNPKTGNLEPYTHPKRHAIKLKADAAFDGTAIFSCSNPAAVRFFTAKEGGTEVKFDGWDNVFRHGAGPKWAPGARLASGVTLYAEAVVASGAMDDIKLELSLSGGSRNCGPKAIATITNLEVFLDICAKRSSPQEDPTPLSQKDKVFVGRELVVQDRAGTFERAQLIIRPVKPAGFKGELELKALSSEVTAFDHERRLDGEAPMLPLVIATDALPTAGRRLWAEGRLASTKPNKAGLVLGVRHIEESADRVAAKVRDAIYITFDDGPYSVTAEVLDVLREEGACATFFLVAENLKHDEKLQYCLVKRMLDEGHAIGNHGYHHLDPASVAAYSATTPAAFAKNYTKNSASFGALLEKHGNTFDGFRLARLQGDGRTQKAYVTMVTTILRVPHVGWDFELAPTGKFKHVNQPPNGPDDTNPGWQGIKGVSATAAGLPSPNSIVLLHDSHWVGRSNQFRLIIRKLKERCVCLPLLPVPRRSASIAYP
jgi:peptidoglycan/xylan/chitin deacetylase (PgdA/CDA1 family)